jgi:hypothetical protein
MSGGIKRDSLDAVFSDLVRERAGYKSEYTGSTDGQMQCCHIYSRKYRSARWHPMNAVCLTASEHARFTDQPVTFSQWLHTKFGADYLYKLAMIVHKPRKFTPRERAGLLKHYKAELERMQKAREAGREGRIDFLWPDPIPESQPRKRSTKKKQTKFKRKVSGQVVLREKAA